MRKGRSAKLDLGLELANTPAIVGLHGVVQLPPAVVGGLGDARLAADVAHRQTLGRVVLDLPQQPSDLRASRSRRWRQTPRWRAAWLKSP